MRRGITFSGGVAGALALAFVACVGDSSIPGVDASTGDGGGMGGEGQPCFADKTCNATLTCVSNACIRTGNDASVDASVDDAADGAVATAPSCKPGGAGMTNCGAGSESCCTSVAVTGGTYDRTYTNNGNGATGKADPATVAGFRLDKYEVTVGRFRQFVGAWNGGAGWLPPASSGKHTHLNGGLGLANGGSPGTYEAGWSATDNSSVAPTNANLACEASYPTWTPSAAGQEKLPINCVNWYEAAAFCIWDGGFLPSEAEWEYAAAGGSEERQYPWGTAAPGTASQYAIYGDGTGKCYYPSGLATCTGASNIAPVGTPTLGVGSWGQLDLAGNVFEWNVDWYAASYTSCTNCGYLTAATTRVVRGDDFYNPASNLLPPNRSAAPPTDRRSTFGVRCARTP
ncbi:hypothetical protein BH09MYX1_BH09MYX1_23320 [soil metagenome]